MTQKPKAPPKPAAEPSTPAQTVSTPSAPAAPVAPAAPAQSATTTTSNPPATPSPAPASTAPASTDPSSFNDPSALALGEQRAAAVANMEAMGFPRDQIDRAMRAAFFNPDRAVQYLLEGIPENILQEQAAAQQQRAAAARPASQQAATTPAAAEQPPADFGGDEPVNLFEAAAPRNAGGAGAGTGAGARSGGTQAAGGQGAGNTQNLDFLRNSPQFQQLRQVVQQQPHMLEMILQQVAAANPQLAQVITSNPEQFMQLLAEEGGDDDAPLPEGATQIPVTEEERDAIERVSFVRIFVRIT